MELRLLEIESNATASFNRVPRSATRSMPRPNFSFMTYAVEIEGEAPLIALAETVDG